MERTTISLPEDLIKQLRIQAAEQRTSMAALIREAVEEKVAAAAGRSRPKSLGAAAFGHTDTGRSASGLRPEPRSWR